MTEEMRSEIIKALAYGLDDATVAECNGVTVEEVRIIAAENRAAVTAKRAEIKEVYPDAL